MKTPESKAQLAALYAPCLSERGALKRLQAWIDFNPRLARALERTVVRAQEDSPKSPQNGLRIAVRPLGSTDDHPEGETRSEWP